MIGLLVAAVLAVAGGRSWDPDQAGALRLLVSGLPYETVWAGAIRAVADYGLARVGEGFIVTERAERPPRAGEEGVDRVAERVVVWVESVGERLTQVRVLMEREGRRAGAWTPLPVSEEDVRAILARIRDVRAVP